MHIRKKRPNLACRRASGAYGLIAAFAQMIEQGFGHDRATGVPGAEDKNLLHQPQHVFSDGSQHSGLPIVSGVQQAPLSSIVPVNICASSIVLYASQGMPAGS